MIIIIIIIIIFCLAYWVSVCKPKRHAEMRVLRVKCQLCFSPIATEIEVAQQFHTEILKKISKNLSGVVWFLYAKRRTDRSILIGASRDCKDA